MFRRYLFLLFASAFLPWGLLSCNKEWLDVKSEDKLAVPATLNDFQALLDNNSVMNTNSPALQEISSDGHYLTDARATALDDRQRNAYTWSKIQPYVGVLDWNNTYKVVFTSNLILEGLEKLEDKSEAFYNVKGQALFQRAKAFFEIAQLWAKPFVETTASADAGIPLRLNSDINIPTYRSTVKQTYEQIISDLVACYPLLPASALYKTRGSRSAAFAMLTRVYLSMEKYAEAKIYADSCLKIKSDLLAYSTLNANASFPIPGYLKSNPEIIYQNTIRGYSANTSNALIDMVLYNSYAANDRRKAVFFKVNTDNTVSFKGSYNESSANFGGLAIDEVYLSRAECYARMGNKDLAMEDLNTLLKSRWSGTYTPLTAVDANEALRIILQERKKELLLRGIRWSDLRRLNRDVRFALTITRVVGGVSYSISPDSYKYTFPIPDDIIIATGIAQNDGWF